MWSLFRFALVVAPAFMFAKSYAARTVYAHYMVGSANEEHMKQDVDDAIKYGIKGFSLNIGDPRPDFVTKTLDIMVPYAATKPDFKVHVSMDLWAAGDAKPKQTAKDYVDLLNKYVTQPGYARGGPKNLPMVTTFADGGLHNDTWLDFRDSLGTEIFFIPDFDGTEGYYDAHPAWWEYWGPVVDGLFSWEAAWPERAGKGSAYPGDIGADEKVMKGALEHKKQYMIGLSPLQYKNAYKTNIYRPGDISLPLRMVNILKMNPLPDFVNIMTWNDGPESHYVGNIWAEQNTDIEPARYATQADAPHTGWLPLLGSFSDAYIRGWSASQMQPMAGEQVTGALWYTTVLKDTKCQTDGLKVSDDDDEQAMYFEKPDGMSNSTDTLNFAVVVPSAGSGWKVQLFSDGDKVLDAKLNPGLNYGTIPGKKAGWQRMHIVDGAGSIVRVAAGGRCVSSGCPDCIYNMNPQVVPLSDNIEDNGSCPIDCSPPETFTPDVCKDGPFSLDTLLDDTPDIPDMCVNEYLITALADALQDALNAYQDIFDDGYDAKFQTYADYTRQSIPEQLDAYMSEHAPDRFSCLEERHQQCCKDCKVACGVCVKGDDCETGVRNFTEPCTKFVPQPSLGDSHEADTVWHFTLSDEDGFYDDISTAYGIDKAWVAFGNRVSNYASGCWSDKCDENMYWTGYPKRAPSVDIENPKEAISEGMTMLRNLREDLADAALAASNDLYPDDLADVIDAATIPVLMAREAVDAMKQVVETAEDIEEQQRKQMILNFVLGILMFIPAAGEAVGAVGLTTLARVITLIGDVGAAAFGVYEIVEDPESAVLLIFSLLMGAGGGRRGDFRKAGSMRRGMKEKDYVGLGTKIRAQMDKVSTKRKGCY